MGRWQLAVFVLGTGLLSVPARATTLIVPDHAPDGNAYLFVMYVGSKHDLSSPGFDEIICFVRPKGGL